MKKETGYLYKVKPPIGNIVMEKETMTEKDIREFIPTLIQDPEQLETWKAKAEEDPIEDLISWLVQAGYEVSALRTLK